MRLFFLLCEKMRGCPVKCEEATGHFQVHSFLTVFFSYIDRALACAEFLLDSGSPLILALFFFIIKEDFFVFLCSVFNTVLSAAPQTPLCRRMLGSNPGQMRLRHRLSDSLTTRLDLIHITSIVILYVSTSLHGPLCGSNSDHAWKFDPAKNTLQGKSHLRIPFLGIARPHSQFTHSCVCERFIYSQDRSTYFPAAE